MVENDTSTYERRPGQLAVWWHERNLSGDSPMSMEVSGVMGARAIVRHLELDRKYHAIRVMKWDGFEWKRVKRP